MSLINPFKVSPPEEEAPIILPSPPPETETLVIYTTPTAFQCDPAFFQSVIWNPLKATLFLVNSSGISEPNAYLVNSYNWDHVEFRLTIFLNEGLTFYSGGPVTADDVVFSLNRLKTLAANFDLPWSTGFCGNILNDVMVTVENIDEVRLQFTQVWNPFFIENMLSQSFSMIMSASADVNVDGTLDTPPLFAGSYIIGDLNEIPIRLVANIEYSIDYEFFFGEIEIYTVESSSMVVATEAGEVDLAVENPNEPSAIQNFSAYDPSLEVVTSEFEEFVVVMNSSIQPFDNLAARTAVAKALDRDDLAINEGGEIAQYDGTDPLKFLGVEFEDPFIYDSVQAREAWVLSELTPATVYVWIHDKLFDWTSRIQADLEFAFTGCSIDVSYGSVPPIGRSLYFLPVSQEGSATRSFRDFAQLFYSGGALGYNDGDFDNYINLADGETNSTTLMTDHLAPALYHLANNIVGFCRLNTARVIRNFKEEGNELVGSIDFTLRNPCRYNYGDLM